MFNIFKKQSKPVLSHRLSESGNVFLMLFGAVGMVGVIGASTMTVMKGPVKTMSDVTKRTVAENNMIATGKLALMGAVNQADGGDCDTDGIIEPIPFGDSITGFTGGGKVPLSIGASLQDSWGSDYAYCAWDHGSGDCGSSNLLGGGDVQTEFVLAVISAGPDRSFQTSCIDFVDGNADDIADAPLINKVSGSDDLILGYTYNEAESLSGGIWVLEDADSSTAEINKNVSIKGTDGTERFDFNSASGELVLGGAGKFPTINTDNIQAFGGAGGTINVDSALSSTSNIVTTANVSAADLIASGNADVTGTLDVTGDTTLAATGVTTLSSSGLATLESLTVTNGSTLADTSTTTLSSSGLASLESLTVTNDINTTVGDITAAGVFETTGGSLYFIDTNQRIRGNGGSTFTLQSNDSNTTSLSLRDKENTLFGALHGTSDGGIIGILDGDNNFSYRAVKDSSTEFRIDNTTEMTISPTTISVENNTIIDVADPTDDQDAATKKYVDDNIAAGTGYTETDPQVDTLEAGKWCTTDGSDIDCEEDEPVLVEVDPKVGTLEAGKFCSTDGSDIDCTSDAATFADNLGNHTASTDLLMGANTVNFGTDNLQTLFGANAAGIFYDSNHSTATTITLRDLENTTYGSVNGGADGEHFGLLDGDSNYNYLHIRDTRTDFRIDNVTEMQLTPTALDLEANKIIDLADPTDDQDAATKKYVDDSITAGGDNLGDHTTTENLILGNDFISSDGGDEGIQIDNGGDVRIDRTGDTYDVWIQGGDHGAADETRNLALLGNSNLDILYLNYNNEYATGTIIGGPATIDGELSLSANKITNLSDPTSNQEAATKKYVDDSITAGGDNLGDHTATENLDMDSNKIVNVTDPTDDQDAATKKYVDDSVTAGGDNLGDHTATTDLAMGANNIELGTDNAQTLSGSNGSVLLYDSNNSSTSRITLRDLENTTVGSIQGSGDGTNFGLLDADNNFSYLAVKDTRTEFRIDNTTEMTIRPTTISVENNSIIDVADPTADQHAATKKYVDDNIAAGTGFTETDPKVGTLTAGRFCSTDGTDIDCTTDSDDFGDDLGDHTATENLDMDSNKIVNVTDPTAAQDAATKKYVDDSISGSGGTTYVSPEQTITDGGSLTLPHGLGTTPLFLNAYIVNKVADGTFSVGDKIVVSPTTTTQAFRGWAMVPDSTNINVYFASGPVLRYANKTTGVNDVLDNSKWKLVVMASTFSIGSNIDNLGNHTAITDIVMDDNKVTGLADPTADQDAATKKYVDDNVGATHVLIETQTASADSTIEFTDIDGTYDKYILEVSDIAPGTDNQRLNLRVSTDNGVTWEDDAGDYRYGLIAPGSSGQVDTSQNHIKLNLQPAGNVGGEAGAFTLTINAPSTATTKKVMYWTLSQMRATGVGEIVTGSGIYNTAEAIDGIQIYYDSGNVETGKFKLYGMN